MSDANDALPGTIPPPEPMPALQVHAAGASVDTARHNPVELTREHGPAPPRVGDVQDARWLRKITGSRNHKAPAPVK